MNKVIPERGHDQPVKCCCYLKQDENQELTFDLAKWEPHLKAVLVE